MKDNLSPDTRSRFWTWIWFWSVTISIVTVGCATWCITHGGAIDISIADWVQLAVGLVGIAAVPPLVIYEIGHVYKYPPRWRPNWFWLLLVGILISFGWNMYVIRDEVDRGQDLSIPSVVISLLAWSVSLLLLALCLRVLRKFSRWMWVPRRRYWIWLWLWSLAVAAVTMGFTARTSVFADQWTEANVILVRQIIGFCLIALATLLLSYMAIFTFKNLPRTRKTWFWLVLTGVSSGIVCTSLVIWAGRASGLTFSAMDLLMLLLAGSVFFLLLSAFIHALRNFFRWLFSWRILKRGLLALAGLIILVAAFYAEEDLRGWFAWNHFKHKWEAKGEKFDFASFIPPPVPDDQNFALTPIVATSYEWMLDKNGHELKPHRTNIVQRLMMEIYHHGDGGTLSNIMPTNGDWRVGRMCDLKSWQLYYRSPCTNMFYNGSYWETVKSPQPVLTNDFPFPPTPITPPADVLLALGKYDSDIEELRAASRLPDSRFPLNYDAKSPGDIYLMHLAPLKYCCQTLQLRAIAELENDESQKALDDVMLSLRLVDSIRTEPSGMSHYTRSEMANLIVQIIWEGLAKHRWSDAQLTTIEQELGKLDFLADCQLSLRCTRNEYLAMTDFMINPHSFRETWMFALDIADPGFHSIETDESKAEFERQVTILAWFYYLMPKGWYYQNELIIARTYQGQILQVVDPARHLFSSQRLGDAGKTIESLPHRRWNFVARGFLGGASFSYTRKLVYAQETMDLARVACALEHYRLAHGEYPETLDALAPQFISQVPHDIIGGQPLHYRRTDGGKFSLYSVGWNGKDDGGVVVFRDHSTYFVDDNKSDWVWHYPAQ